MKTPEEFQSYVSCLIRQKKKQRRQRIVGIAAVMVVAILWGIFRFSPSPTPSQNEQGFLVGGGNAVARDPSPLEEALQNGQTQCELPAEIVLKANGQSQTITDKETLSTLCSLILECRLNPDYSDFSEDWDILFSYTGGKGVTSLFFTEEGFFTADGAGYSPDDPETWYQQLRALLF